MNNEPVILIEVKPFGTDLTLHNTQLFRYFTATDAKFGVLTDGLRYRFFSDLEEKNKMDNRPFFEINLLDADGSHISEMRRFEKDSFDLEEAAAAAAELKYTRRILLDLEKEVHNPSDDFLTYWLRKSGIARVTKARRTELKPVVKRALNQFIHERVNSRLKSAKIGGREEQGRQEEAENAAENQDRGGGRVRRIKEKQ